MLWIDPRDSEEKVKLRNALCAPVLRAKKSMKAPESAAVRYGKPGRQEHKVVVVRALKTQQSRAHGACPHFSAVTGLV